MAPCPSYILHVDPDSAGRALVKSVFQNGAFKIPLIQRQSLRSEIEGRERISLGLLLCDIEVANTHSMAEIREFCEENSNLPVVALAHDGEENSTATALQMGAKRLFIKDASTLADLPRQLSSLLERRPVKSSDVREHSERDPSSNKYRDFFEDSPVALWEEDFTELQLHMKELRQQGIQDLDEYFDQHPGELVTMADMIEVLDVNQEALHLLGASSKKELTGKIGKLFTDTSLSAFRLGLMEIWKGKNHFSLEGVNRTMDGRDLHLLFRFQASPSVGESDRCKYLLALTDISDRVDAENRHAQAEQKLQRAQKMESLGVLAGGIAHDFNNILTAILGNTDLLLDQLSAQDSAYHYLEEIEKATLRAADLANQMLAYSGKGAFVLKKIHLGQLVKEMTHLLEVAIPPKSSLKLTVEDNLPLIQCDTTQIRQVIIELAINAAESYGGENGCVDILIGSRECAKDFFESSGFMVPGEPNDILTSGLYSYLCVKDHGCGMSAETQEKIFDPFYTTKFTGRGLGMSAVIGIVRGHHGAIRIQSEVGKGSELQIFFPTTEAMDPDGNSRGKNPDIENWQGTGTVLVVDDDASVLDTTEKMLAGLGFQTLNANSGVQAIEMLKTHPKDIDLVLLDLSMPDMDGLETFRAIRKIQPDMRIVLCSGYCKNDATQSFPAGQLSDFIQKPFGMVTLRERLMKLFLNRP